MLTQRSTAATLQNWTQSYIDDASVIAEVDAVVYDNVELARAELADVGTALEALGKTIGPRVFVPACGTGRHVYPLVQAGLTVYAADFSREFLRRAVLRTMRMTPLPSYCVWDITKRFPHTEAFNTCLLLGGSFGYNDDATNFKTLAVLRESLKDDGALVLDVTDPVYARQMAQRRPFTSEFVDTPSYGRVHDARDRFWNEETHRMQSRKRHIQMPGGRILLDVEYDIAIYEVEYLCEQIRAAGFSAVHVQRASGSSDDALGLMAGRVVIAAACG